MATETASSGLLDGLSLTNAYSSHGNREDLTVALDSTNLVAQSYSYNASTGRLETVTDKDPDALTPRTSATYAYKPASSLVQSITLNNGTSGVLTRTRTYDALSRVKTVVATDASAKVLNSHAYTYDARSRRERNDREDGTYWAYGYNDRNEVTSGVKYFSDETAIPGFQFGYDFDDIGNRDEVTLEGVTYDWSANALNQVSERAVPAVAVVSGTANPQAAIFVNGLAADRHDDYWSAAVTVDNTSASAAESLSIDSLLAPNGPEGEVLVGDTIDAGTLFVPQTPESYVYDDDGNLTQDGRWSYTWNAENRLVEQDTLASAVTAGVSDVRVTYAYDFLGRMIERKVYIDDVLNRTELFIWDGYNQVAKLDDSGTLQQVYCWGLGLSGTMQGAGGVGGLLSVADLTGSNEATFLAYYDANGNVSGYADASDGSIAAQFEYSPFGEELMATGTNADQLTDRFSTKPTDDATGIIHYELRPYSPMMGKWLGRDPIEEQGGLNLYAFVGNDAVNAWDYLGLAWPDDPYKIAFKGANPEQLLGIPVSNWQDGAGLIDVGSDQSYASLESRRAINDVIDYFDISGDGKLDEKDCPPFDLRITGYSWGGWTALEVSHYLSSHRKIKNPRENLRIVLGLVDPVNSGRFTRTNQGRHGPRIPTVQPGALIGNRPSSVIYLVSYYETFGLKIPVVGSLFAGSVIRGADSGGLVNNTNHVWIVQTHGLQVANTVFNYSEN